MGRLKIIVTGYVSVEGDDLRHYDASTLEEAAANQQTWVNAGRMGVGDVLLECEDVEITVTVDESKDDESKDDAS